MKSKFGPLSGLGFGLLALALSVSAAHAQFPGLSISWAECGSFGTATKVFACDTNSGSSRLMASLAGLNLTGCNGAYAVVDIQNAAVSIPDWWAVQPGDCRPGALTANFSFPVSSQCLDPWSGTGVGGMTVYPGEPYQNSTRLRILVSIPGSVDLHENEEYNLFSLEVSHANSTGAGACGGCSINACIFLRLVEPTVVGAVPQPGITQPYYLHYASWQDNGFAFCPPLHEQPVPARSATWGTVKSLYR